MLGAGAKPCSCGHGDAATAPSSSMLFNHKDTSPKKYGLRKPDAPDGLSGPSNECPHLAAFSSKRHPNHWWEAPAGNASRGRAASCMLTNEGSPISPTRSDLTFEAGMVPDFQQNDALVGAPMKTPLFPKKSISSSRERHFEGPDDSNPPTASRLESLLQVKIGPTEGEGGNNQPSAAPSNDRTSRWTDENGKMTIRSDVFDAVLPSADEVSSKH